MSSLFGMSILSRIESICDEIATLETEEQIEIINAAKVKLHQAGPFANEPVDCVLWVRNEKVEANDYNPNAVAPPEMRLLEHSIREDGYTQPIVTWAVNGHMEVVDGFHRNRVGKESKRVKKRTGGYLPVVSINSDREDKGDRIAATIRHNRARGKHNVNAMSEIIVDLRRRCWTNEKISKELGMEPDEVLRLSQISGLAEMFANREFSEAWEVDWTDDEHE